MSLESAHETSTPESAIKFDIYDHVAANKRNEIYAELRAKCPVAHSDQVEEDGFWLVTKYDDVVEVSLDTDTYSSKYITLPRDQFGADNSERPPITLDPPRHTKFRQLLQPNFTTPEMKRWVPRIREVAQAELSTFLADGRCDASGQYAKRISMGMMRAIFNVPAEMESAFSQWLHDLVESGDETLATQAATDLYAYLDEQATIREHAPQDDLITKILTSEIDGERLNREELLGTFVVLMTAALETVASTLSGAMVHLATNPSDRHRLVEDPSMIPTAVEEFLRFYAPVTLTRETTRETVLRGVTIPQESLVLLCWASANRDSDAFPEPDKFIVDRRENRHLAFGVGRHRCLGSALARFELQVALEEWLKVIPDFELDGEVPGYMIGLVNGPISVPVKFPPPRRSA